MLIGPNQPRPELSDQWVLEPLQNLVIEMADGGTPPRSDHENFGGGIPWVVVSDIARTIEATEETLSDIGLRRCSARIWPQGAIIVSTGATIGEVGIAAVPLATKQGITGILVDSSRLDPRFFAHCLVSGRRVLERYAQGSTFLEIRVPTLERLRLGLPACLSEQQRIAEILSTVDEAIAQTEALIAKTQQIKAGLMSDLFTRGVTADGHLRPPREEAPQLYKESPLGWIPKDWGTVLLDDLAIRGSGHTPNKNHPEYWNGTIKWVSLADSWRLDRVHISDTEHHITEAGIENSSAVLHPAGIVVLSRDAGVGKSAVTTSDMAVSQHFMCWRCGPRLHNYYLYYWLQHRKWEFENIATGSTIPTIGLRFFRHYRINVPVQVAEQSKIAATLLAADDQAFALQNEVLKLRDLRMGLMQDLLTGHVTVTQEASVQAVRVAADV